MADCTPRPTCVVYSLISIWKENRFGWPLRGIIVSPSGRLLNAKHAPRTFPLLPRCNGYVGELGPRLRVRQYDPAPTFLSVPSSQGKCFEQLPKSRENKAFLYDELLNFSKSLFLHETPLGLRNDGPRRYPHRNSGTRSPCTGFLRAWPAAFLPLRSFAGFLKASFSFGPLDHASNRIRLHR